MQEITAPLENPIGTPVVDNIIAKVERPHLSDQGTTPAAAPEKTAAAVHCMGINSCKGTGSCKSEKNGCKGQNNCKAMGMTDTATAEECTTKGGTVAAGN